MKRSEMINVLQKAFIEHMNCGKECCSTDEQLYSTVLQQLETLGMKPPERPFWNRNPNGSLMPHSKNGEMVNTWEPEDKS